MMELKLLVILSLTPAYAALLQAVFSRAARVSDRKTSAHSVVIVACLAGFLAALVLAWAFYLKDLGGRDAAIAFIYSLIVSLLLSYSYFHVFNMSETARRIRILYEIHVRGRLKAAELDRLYGAGEMLENRIERLVSMGQIRKDGDSYVLTSKILYFAALLIAGWGKVLGLPSPKDVYRVPGRKR